MSAILLALKAKAGLIGLGLVSSLIGALLVKKVPKWIDSYVGEYLDKALDVKQPEDRELVLALVKWAEIKLPDRGQGEKKFDMVAAKITTLFPVLKKQQSRISQLIESSVWQLNDELRERNKKDAKTVS